MNPVKWIGAVICLPGCLVMTDSCSQPSSNPSVFASFTGSTPCTREAGPLPGMLTGIECDYMKWEMVLYNDSTYQLNCRYGTGVPNTNTLKSGGTKLERSGKWSIGRGTATDSSATVYRLAADKPHAPLYFQKLDDNLLHLLNNDKSLMIGTSGWSFTLSRANPLPVATGFSGNTINAAQISLRVTGDTSLPAVFNGRTPCAEIARQLRVTRNDDCKKIKWSLRLYHDPKTLLPTTYKLDGTLYREKAKEGRWMIIKGMAGNPDAIVYVLDADKPAESIHLLKGDDNILFMVDENGRYMPGNADFSYALNREN